MRNWLNKMQDSMRRWMYGRYGMDELSIFLMCVGIALSLMSSIWDAPIAYWLAWVLLVWALYRCYSKKIYNRSKERSTFLRMTAKPKNWFKLQRDKWRDRKKLKYFRCKNCKAVLRVPRGKGKIEITCPKCGTKVIRKT